MESSALQLQEMATENSMENMLLTSKQNQQALLKAKPPQEQPQKCPRCDSINTKFCYYNNYSLSQPRYFCKSCRRYWTKGGTLRNIPVGGGCRRNKRLPPSKKAQPDQQPQFGQSSNPVFAFDGFQKQSNGQLGFDFDPIFGNQQFGGFGNPNGNGFCGGLGEVERFCGDQMMVPFDHQGDESKMLLGFEYGFDFGRESASWSNVIGGPSSTWHGVLNSPLM